MIATVTTLFIITILMYFITILSQSTYNQNLESGDLNEADLYKYQKLNETYSSITIIKSDIMTNSTAGVNVLDMIGGIYSSGIAIAKNTVTTFDTANTMTSDVVSDTNLEDRTMIDIIKTYIYTILIIIFFVAIIFAIVLKWNP
jgi:hypothetical protein